MNKKKILNDPVYGFINIPDELLFDIIEHRYFQRLRRIKQLGLTDFIYPGALHTRFHHALGAMHLMTRTLNVLRDKEVEITPQEFQATQIAILLHDIGHGPFSHTLEYSIFDGLSHEEVGLLMMQRMNEEFDGALHMAIQIFTGSYEKAFLHQLVSSQLDIDRLDYLKRDSFFTGVYEGAIGSERIIKMLDVKNGDLVVEEKGILSIENFLSARRLMYWQVYHHKVAVSAEVMLTELIKRAKRLAQKSKPIASTPALSSFLANEVTIETLNKSPEILEEYAQLDDYDIWGSMKFWTSNEDFVLKELTEMLFNRKLFGIQFFNDKVEPSKYQDILSNVQETYKLSEKKAKYFVRKGTVTNSAYISSGKSIKILMKSGEVVDVAEASDLPNIKAMSKIVKKYYLCAPKTLYI